MTEKSSRTSQFAEIEQEVLGFWEKDKTFEKSVENRKGKERFVFNDGPPFANGLPHFGHSLVTGIKDSILRYKTMRGYYVPRRNGWDCHGLPVEYAIEKEFGVSGKKQIEELGLEKFNQACRDSIFKYKADWEGFLKRYGRWSDYEDYYATVDTNYTESVWWILSEINKKGLLYRGLKSVPYCPRCATPLSNFELNEGYKDDIEDPSLFVKFKTVDLEDTYLLAWTTTPWSLPGNAAIAVQPNEQYVFAEIAKEKGKPYETLILALKRIDVLKDEQYTVIRTIKGSELVGTRYEPLFWQGGWAGVSQYENLHNVISSESVDIQDGTGILHVAPAFGEEDLKMSQEQSLPVLSTVDSSGQMLHLKEIPAIEGVFFKEADRPIIDYLSHQGLVFAAESNFRHTYPFCWRCDTPLMYYATSTWFVAVTKVKEDMLKTAEEINWVPSNIKNGRFGKWLEGARDWAISRNRYWGAPMPIWQNVDDEEDFMIISSIDELKELAGTEVVEKSLKKDGKIDLHRPFIDEITFQKDGKTYKRIEEVLDCWFESGSMPLAQWHYPFENREEIKELLTADFITEGLDQTRLWFYVQHVISTIIFDKPAYKNVITTGIILAADGQKLSKRLKNYPPVDEVFDHEGADAWRLYLLSSTQATETADYMRFRRDAVTDLQRNVLGTLYNSFKFFDTYSKLDKWQAKGLDRPESDSRLDKWVLARIDETVMAATKSADDFKIAHAIEPVVSLIDDLSNWYIRRSRKRFWKSENDSDKKQAYATLFYSLATTCQLLAPWGPFLSDKIWREITDGTDLPESVHLNNWPSVKEPDSASHKLLEDMQKVRQVVVEGLAQRAEAKIKVRQPLQSVKIEGLPEIDQQLSEIAKEELNVKTVEAGSGKDLKIHMDTEITGELKREGIARELIRSIQNARKKAGFNVEDRIHLKIESESSEITEAVEQFHDLIYSETLAKAELSGEGEYNQEVDLDTNKVKISLQRT